MPPKGTSKGDYRCSFCGKGQAQVRHLVAGSGAVFICDECVQLCQQVIAADQADGGKTMAAPEKASPTLTPSAIYDKLGEYVVGQERAKKVLSVAVYNHYKRINARARSRGRADQVELQKSNILLIGPTGSGKTLLAQTLAKILDVPFAISDATSLTEAGYVGEDVEHVLLRLVQAADWDLPRAERGVAYIDEVDKIARKGSNPSITRDVSGEGVQQALLKILEGTLANVPPSGGRKHPHQEFLQVRTNDILFVCGGTFEGLEQIVERRVRKDRHAMGFLRDASSGQGTEQNLLRQVNADDLLAYGFIPEFVGRMPVIVTSDPLTMESLVRILVEPKNAVVKQYQALFQMDDVELVFSQAALEEAAREALQSKTGARGLRTVVEDVLTDVMYELPSLKEVRRCVVDGDTILNRKRPILLNAGGNVVEPKQNRQTA